MIQTKKDLSKNMNAHKNLTNMAKYYGYLGITTGFLLVTSLLELSLRIKTGRYFET